MLRVPLYNCLFPQLRCQHRAEASARSILRHFIYAAVLRAMLPGTYCQDGMYAGFAGAKTCHEKNRINRDTLMGIINGS